MTMPLIERIIFNTHNTDAIIELDKYLDSIGYNEENFYKNLDTDFKNNVKIIAKK